jgi:hypothetical protein
MRQPSYRRFTDPAERDATIEDYQVGFDRLSAKLGELRGSVEGSFERLDAKIDKFGDSLEAKLDLLIELSAKIDWTKHRKSQLNQDDNAL